MIGIDMKITMHLDMIDDKLQTIGVDSSSHETMEIIEGPKINDDWRTIRLTIADLHQTTTGGTITTSLDTGGNTNTTLEQGMNQRDNTSNRNWHRTRGV